ncbi:MULTISPECIES: hypothetical protein [unclassified Candidatus Tisiphia]|uniref:hypothetical protein n=1 Tax=unclassified Candidatus Tisiphia TaxID=2996318 RepID=UPI0035C88DB4
MEQEAVGQPGTYSLNRILPMVIKDDDLFKESKTKQITRWVYKNYEVRDYFEAVVSAAISADDCWLDDNIYGKRLNTKILAQRLIDNSLKSNFKDSFDITYCFRLACLNCLDETLIRNLFDLKKAKYQKVRNVSEDNILKQEVTILERFWGHYITDKLEQIKENDIYFGYYDPNLNIYGLKLAYYNNEREAVAFFSTRLLEDSSISAETRLNLLVEAALYSASSTAGNRGKDVAIFCLQEAMKDKQQLDSFLEKFSHPRGPSILKLLIEEGYFDTVCQLFPIQAQFYNINKYYSLLSAISDEKCAELREKFLHDIIELGREKFWQQVTEFDNNNYSNLLLNKCAENGYKKALQELWHAYSDDQRQHVFLCSTGKIICSILYENDNKESLKEFLFCYAKNNKAVLEDINQFINNIDISVNNYISTGDTKNNKFSIINDKIKETLPQLMEVFNEKRTLHDTDASPISSNNGSDTSDALECLGKLDIVEEQ